ncbi:MAG: hypothetical protein RLZZ242_1158 [Bacteroidota bacterium]|jgi:TM2 domain-containing membrane protein YozV
MSDKTVGKPDHQMYCAECGKLISKRAAMCPNCGLSYDQPAKQPFNAEPRFLATLLLCWFLGVFGVHRFYTGHTTIGVIQLFTLGGCGIWVIIDFILIVTGGFKDVQGIPIRANG